MKPSSTPVDRPLPASRVDEAARILLNATPPGSRVILFGSYARGEAGPDSDLDFLVVEPEPADPHMEAVRLRRLLPDWPTSLDVLVTSIDQHESWRTVGGTVSRDADRNGRVYHRGG